MSQSLRSSPAFRLTTLVLALVSCSAFGQSANVPAPLRQAAQKAVASNPEVTARFNAFQAADQEIGVARGGYLPRLDLSGTVGRTRDTIKGRAPEETATLNQQGAALTLSQMLWDGLATRDEVRRLDHASKTRYFELLDTTEQTALEATKAYYDVLRYRQLVALAENNYVQHKHVHDQISSRVKAGVGRGVDLEQAGARLALAESNLTTENANLHDVSTRYARVVGEVPPASLPAFEPLGGKLAAGARQASDVAAERSPAVQAAVENLRAVRSQAHGRDAAFQPTVEARVRGGGGHNFDGVPAQRKDVTGEVVLNWNLFNGGSDLARARQYSNLVNQAADLRDKACRDSRQTAAIAYNDTVKLSDQIRALERNTSAIQKARDAYRQQFDIGQRSLLDLLNAENELYTAQRSLTQARYDLTLAQARSHASSQTLTQVLGITRTEPENAPDVSKWQADDDAATRCPVSDLPASSVSLAQLDRQAAPTAPVAAAAPAPAPVPLVSPAPTPAAATAAAALAEQRLSDWAAAWSSKDVDRYLGFYSKDFRADQSSHAAWMDKRRQMLSKPGDIRVAIDGIRTTTLAADKVQTSFRQTYQSANFNDVSTKVLTWQRIGNDWLIVRESNR